MSGPIRSVSDGALRRRLTGLFAAGCAFLAASRALAGLYDDAFARFNRAQAEGFRWTSADRFPDAFQPRRGASNDGPLGLPLLGGIGTGGFGRDLEGHFDRWQLQPGFPRMVSVDAASLCLRWSQEGRSGAYRVGEAGWDRPLPAGTRSVAVLWPVVAERLASPGWPVEAVIESWSPVVPHDERASGLPVAFFDVYVRNRSSAVASFDLALFFPNFLGWREGPGLIAAPAVNPRLLRDAGRTLGPRTWPERSNSGNFAEAAEPDPAAGLRTAVLQRRAGYAVPVRDVEGEVLLGVAGGPEVRARRDVCMFASTRGGANPATDRWTLNGAEKEFFATGSLPSQERGWEAEANEVLASAVAGGVTLAPGEESHFTLVVVWDLPLAEFGSGRTWEKAYTSHYGAAGRSARQIALDALASRADWREQIDRWQTKTLGSGPVEAQRRRAACVNDLAYVISGGSAWVAREHTRPGLEPPLLGSGEHFSILEGCDTGYYFCTTFDLWPYAQPAFEANWPHLADLVERDYLRTAPMAIGDPRFILGTNRFTIRKVPNKVPHDLGCPSGDPWSLLNEYGSARDSNVWKDHDPAFVLSYYLHREALGSGPPSDTEWKTLLGLADFMIAQDKLGDGLPYHDTQGDSTWDALQFHGPSPYSGALTIGAWAALADWARQRGDSAEAARFAGRLALAQRSFEACFWNGRYYRSAINGPQADWVMADALFGILMADSAGLHGLLPADHIAAHLREVATRNWKAFGGGAVGPSLLAPPAGPIPHGVQVGEVIVGSAFSCAALMRRYGLAADADGILDALDGTLYQTSGLQFRIPAALTPERTYRAPANLRPLASWYTLWP